MGCGPSADQPRRPSPHGGDTGIPSRTHPGRPGVNQVVRPGAQDEYTRKKDPDQAQRKTSFNNQNKAPDKPEPIGYKIPKRRKKQLIPDVSVFEKRDSWAQKVPNEHCKSVADLARYLTHEAKSDLEKVRSFYRWMTLNICYDAEGYLTRQHRYPADPPSVIKYRIAVCHGYAQLFEALCTAVGIPCRYIAGFSKGTSYDPDVPITEHSYVNHAWNIVCVNGEWWPVDSTWGAGYMNSKNRFEWHYNELNFLTDPDVFILAHFPFMDDNFEYSAQFQLLKQPITLDEFNINARPDRNGMEWGLELLSHNHCTIVVERDVTIKFRTTEVVMTNVSCNFNAKRTGEDFESYVILYQKEGIFSAKVKPPREGVYKLTLFGETEGMTKHQGLITYTIHCSEADEDAQPYPEHFGMWGSQPKAAECGFDDGINDLNVFLSEDGNLKFSIPLKESVDTIVRLEHPRESSDLESFVSDASNDKVMVILARLPYSGYYKMQLFACDPDSGGNSYIPVAFFFINCLKGLKSATPFSNSNEAQKFLKAESSKSKKKKKTKTKTPTPPPTPPETEESEEEEDDEEEEDAKRNHKPVRKVSRKSNASNSREEQPYNAGAPRITVNEQEDYNSDEGHDSKSKDTPNETKKKKTSVSSTGSVRNNSRERKRSQLSSPSLAISGYNQQVPMYDQQGLTYGQQGVVYDQQGNLYDQYGNIVQPGSMYNQQSMLNSQQLNFDQPASMMYDPYTGTMVPAVVRPNSRQIRQADEKQEDENDDEEEKDEDGEEDEDDTEETQRKTKNTQSRSDEPYPGKIIYDDSYKRTRRRKVVPAVAEPEEDDEQDDEGDDEEENDNPEPKGKNRNWDEKQFSERRPNSEQELSDEDMDVTKEDERQRINDKQRHVPYKPHQAVHRVSTISQPDHQPKAGDDDEDEEGEDDDNDNEERTGGRGLPQHGHRNNLDPYHNPYNYGYISPSYSDAQMYGQSGLADPYYQRGYLSPSGSTADLRGSTGDLRRSTGDLRSSTGDLRSSTGDLRSPHPIYNPYRSVVSPRTVYRPY